MEQLGGTACCNGRLVHKRRDVAKEAAAILEGERANASASHALRVKRLHPDARLPERATEGSTGLDLFAYIGQQAGRVALEEKPKLIGTGIAVEAPKGYDVQIRPRSGLSAKGAMAAFGTIDSDYRGEVMVTMYTLGGGSRFEVKHGDRIAQIVISRVAELPIEEAEGLSSTERGPRGHGSTGMA